MLTLLNLGAGSSFNFIRLSICNLYKLIFKRPLSRIDNIFIEDQFISYCIRHTSAVSPEYKYQFNPSYYDYLKALISFSYSLTVAKFIASRFYSDTTHILLSHEIYNYSIFARYLSSKGFKCTIALKLPFSYTIPPFYNFAQYEYPPFLNLFNKYLSSESLSLFAEEHYLVASDYLKERVQPENKNLFYLRRSAYSQRSIPSELAPLLSSSSPYLSFTSELLTTSTDMVMIHFHRFGNGLVCLDHLISNYSCPILVKVHPNTDLNSLI